jgi:replicative superfamily II helicase
LAETIRRLRRRVEYGAKEELFPLLTPNIDQLGRARARQLYNNGVCNLEQLAKTDPTNLQLRGADPKLRARIVERAREITEAIADARKNVEAASVMGAEEQARIDIAYDIAGRFRMNVSDVLEFLLPES